MALGNIFLFSPSSWWARLKFSICTLKDAAHFICLSVSVTYIASEQTEEGIIDTQSEIS